MRHIRKKSSSAALSTHGRPHKLTSPVKYIKRFLAPRQYSLAKEGRARSESSSIVVLSITSSFSDFSILELGEGEDSSESDWRVAYGAARMAVEIANSTSDMFLPLKAVVGALSVLIENYDRTTANTEQIKDIKERVQSLTEVLESPAGEGERDEKARREVLRKKLVQIVAKLRPLSEEHGLVKFLKNVDHANTLNGLVQDLTNAVTDYQISIQQSIYENTRNIIGTADLEFLGKLNPIHTAGYQAGHHDTCLRGTRQSVLGEIMKWVEDPQERQVFWLNGLAGTGKSTIAQTFSEMLAETGALGASFFCSRDYLDRKELKNIFPTLAYQLACRYPSFRRQIIRVIKQDPSVARNSLISQLGSLIVNPLSSTHISCVIVVDALDECIDDQPASAILSVLGRFVKQLPSVRFFITGRPEPRIRTGFRLPLLEPFTQVFLLHEVKLSSVDKDILVFLRERMVTVIKRRSDFNVSHPWPRDDDLTVLTKKSSGLFIFASTLARFIESEHHNPVERLRLIIEPPDSTVHEGRAGIDPLYTQVLLHAFSGVNESTTFANLRKVLGAVILAFNPLSRVQIVKILEIDTSLVTSTLRHLHSVLLVPGEATKEIRIFHKSFPDFLQDRGRCSDPRFFIDSAVHHGDMALGCLELLKKLKPNPCNLPSFIMNKDAADLPELLEDRVGSPLRYACSYWAMHVRSSPLRIDYPRRLVASAIEFFKNNAVPWIEVMSLDNRLEDVIHSIHNLFEWLDLISVSTSSLRRLAEDCLRFTMNFFHLIQRSAPHIYHSALPLSPRRSVFRSKALEDQMLITGFYGRPHNWGSVIRTIDPGSNPFTCMTTFGHRIAAACDDGTVGIYDSITGVMKLSLCLTDPVQTIRGSPNGSTLFCAHQEPSITLWDIQTGGLIHTFVLDQAAGDVAVSSNGRYLACSLSDGSVKVMEIEDKAVRNTIEGDPLLTTRLCWLEPEGHLLIAKGALVETWDVVNGRAIRRFTVQDPVCSAIYSTKFNKLAIVTTSRTKNTVILIDPRKGTSIPYKTQHLSCFAFSQTTKELVCGAKAPGLELFNISTWGRRKFDHPATITSVSTLSNGTAIANVTGSGIQWLNLEEGHTTPRQPPIPSFTVHLSDEERIIVAFGGDRITLLEAASMSLLLTIHLQAKGGRPPRRSPVLCASLENRMAFYCFTNKGKHCLQMWRFSGEAFEGPAWTIRVREQPLVGGISPTGALLVTFHDTGHDHRPYICAWDTQNGRLRGQLLLGTPPSPLVHPSEIRFEAEDRFYSHYDTYRVPYVVSSPTSDNSSHSITCHASLPLAERSWRGCYDVDDTREWVIGFNSKRVCWIPPGYIGSVRSSYCWVGHSLVMAGRDGALRRLTFRE